MTHTSADPNTIRMVATAAAWPLLAALADQQAGIAPLTRALLYIEQRIDVHAALPAQTYGEAVYAADSRASSQTEILISSDLRDGKFVIVNGSPLSPFTAFGAAFAGLFVIQLFMRIWLSFCDVLSFSSIYLVDDLMLDFVLVCA
ncbi:TPA: hypothetical protein RZC51_001557 [Burkholderia cenocepacia]|nr:hypothetical protein [Burkholderia cenocepacia]